MSVSPAPQGTSLPVDAGPKRVYFTGFANDDSTALTSAANGTLPLLGVVCYTEPGGKQGRGVDVTKPATAVLALFAGIVVKIDDPRVGQAAVAGDGSGITAGNLIPGWITVVSAAAAIQALTKANMTKPSTTPFLLGPVNASWNLEAITSSIASGAANFLALTQAVALALETVDTSTTAAAKWVRLGGNVGGGEL